MSFTIRTFVRLLNFSVLSFVSSLQTVFFPEHEPLTPGGSLSQDVSIDLDRSYAMIRDAFYLTVRLLLQIQSDDPYLVTDTPADITLQSS